MTSKLSTWWEARKRKASRRRHRKQYTYGHIINLDGSVRCRARLNKITGRAEKVLWQAGQQGHKANYWHPMGYGWELQFRPDGGSLMGTAFYFLPCRSRLICL